MFRIVHVEFLWQTNVISADDWLLNSLNFNGSCLKKMKISRFNSLLRCYNSSPGRLSRKDDQAGSSHALPINRFSASPLKNSSPIDDLSYDFFEQGSRCFCDSSYERPEIDKKKDFFSNSRVTINRITLNFDCIHIFVYIHWEKFKVVGFLNNTEMYKVFQQHLVSKVRCVG